MTSTYILCMSLRYHSYQTALQIHDKNQNSKMINAGEEIEKWDSDPLLEKLKLTQPLS